MKKGESFSLIPQSEMLSPMMKKAPMRRHPLTLPTRRSPGRWTPGRYFRKFAFGTMSPSASSLPMDTRFG